MSGARGGGDTAPSGGRDVVARPRTIYLVGGGVLAVAATAALILTDNPRLLKVAVIVAVWACVLALLAGVRPRAEDELSSAREEELRHTFELELDREVAARREYELRLEVALRRELENTLKQDLGELRSQVGALRKEIAERSGGELRLERFAVRAESTRLSGGDRQALQQQAERLGLELPERGGSAMIEQGTASYPSVPAGRAAAPTAGNGLPANTPASNGQPLNGQPAKGLPANGLASNGQPGSAPASNGARPGRDPLLDPLPAWIDRPDRTGPDRASTDLPTGVTPIYRPGRADAAPRELPTGPPSLPGVRPGSAVSGALDDPTAGRGGAGSNGYVRPGQPGRRHRRAAEDPTADRMAPVGPEARRRAVPGTPPAPAQPAPGTQPVPDIGWPPAPSPDASGQYLREAEETGDRRRRRRYREDDEENDVLTRMRRQR